MKPNILTREHLEIIDKSIDKHGGSVSVRYLVWNHFIQRHIIDEAVEAGFLELATFKPPTGRPSLVITKVSINPPTKLPRSRRSLEDCISCRHWNFASNYVLGEYGLEDLSFKRRAYVAYQKAYPSAHSIAGAQASASRLLKQSHIQAAIQWHYAHYCDSETDCRGHYPRTETEIWETLQILKSRRARWAPVHVEMNISQNT